MLTKYEERLNQINNDVYELGVKVVDANKVILQGLENHNYNIFEEARDSLKNVEKEASDIDNKIVTTLALFAPEARDLREMVSFLKITNEIVRASANTKSFLKNFMSQANSEIDCDLICEFAIPLQQSTVKSFEYAVEMIITDESEMIEELCSKANIEETKADDLYAIVEKNLLTKIVTNKELSKEYFEILGSIRKLEKIADRAAGIANLQRYAQFGGDLTK